MSHFSYSETLNYLYTQLPVFQHSGAGAYKPGLGNALALAQMFGNPHKELRTIHIAGTNGKGSTAHTLAAVLQSAGYKTGLFTSPHLVDFRERIRVNGRMIPREQVIDFVERYREKPTVCEPSFFELTTIMAFEWFKDEEVDVAVIETGLGGRLDTTNIINPDLSIITNISFDHTALLGNTIAAIAAEKAGIIKHKVPVVIGRADKDEAKVFKAKAKAEEAPIVFADKQTCFHHTIPTPVGIEYIGTPFGDIHGELCGEYQLENSRTVISALQELKKLGYDIDDSAVAQGFANVTRLTGLMGRWMRIGQNPLVVADTGHNIGGWKYLARQINAQAGHKYLVLGFVSDKDVSAVMAQVRNISDSTVLFTRASVERAMEPEALASKAAECGVRGECYATVGEAYKKALGLAAKSDMIFIGGSTFVVADFLSEFSEQQ